MEYKSIKHAMIAMYVCNFGVVVSAMLTMFVDHKFAWAMPMFMCFQIDAKHYIDVIKLREHSKARHGTEI